MSLTVERVEDGAAFAALSQEWDARLPASSANGLFLTWEWLHSWWRHLGAGRRLFILTVRRGPELVAVAPLSLVPPRLERLLLFRSLELLGTGSVGSDYLDLIVRRGWEDDTLEALADHLGREGFMLQLGQLPRGRSLAIRLAGRLAPRGWTWREAPTAVCPFITLAGQTWESYLAALGPVHFQPRLRSLQRRFTVEFDRVRLEEDRGPALDRLIGLHRARWGERGESEAFSSAGLVSFHQELTRRALARGWLRLFELRLDGRPAASLYGFRYGRTFSFYQSGFDPRHAKDSVGWVTIGLTIKSAIEEGAAEYDLLHGDEAYKFRWARETRELGRLELYPPGARWFVCRHAVGLNRAARTLARRVLPPPLAASLAEALLRLERGALHGPQPS
jgi:CelD/BcsL family acetyltransferase involved in cellulose biosynthesis